MFRDFRSAIGSATVTAALATSAVAQDAEAIAAAIGHQLDAFKGGDLGAAWDDASPGIQRMFGSAQNFSDMVRSGYPMVWDNAGVTYLDLRTEADGRLWQRVRIIAADGTLHLLDYAMIATPGGWKIDAVVMLPAPDVGV